MEEVQIGKRKSFRARPNPEELYNNKFTRTNGVFNTNDFNFTHELGNYHSGGGLNLRGYRIPTQNMIKMEF